MVGCGGEGEGEKKAFSLLLARGVTLQGPIANRPQVNNLPHQTQWDGGGVREKREEREEREERRWTGGSACPTSI